MKQRHSTYEENYFENQYRVVSDFTQKDIQKNKNWFLGIFHAIDPFTNILQGKDKTALEFGCATGAAAQVLSEHGYKVSATDVSAYAIRRAKKLFPDINFFIHNIQKPLKGKKYDLVLALDVIEHVEQPFAALKNMCSIVSPNGMVVCSTPNDYAHEKIDPTHISVKRPEVWKKLFQKAGFHSVEIRQMTFLPFFYRFHWRLSLPLAIGINFHTRGICAPVFIVARKKG